MRRPKPNIPVSRSVGVLMLHKNGKPLDDLLSMQDQTRLVQDALNTLSAAVRASENFWLTELVGRFVSVEGKLGVDIRCVLKTSPGLDLRISPAQKNASHTDCFEREFDTWRTMLERAYKAEIIDASRMPDRATAGTRYFFDEQSTETKPLLSISTNVVPGPSMISSKVEKAIHGLQEFNLDGGNREQTYCSGLPTTIRGLPKLTDAGFMITLVDAPREFVKCKLFLAASEMDVSTYWSVALSAKHQTLTTLTLHISVATKRARCKLTGTIAQLAASAPGGIAE